MKGDSKTAKVTVNGVTVPPAPTTENQRECLKVLASGEMAFSIIVKRLGRDSGNVGRTLRQLVKRNLVVKQDKTKHYFLTQHAKKWLLENAVQGDSKGVTVNRSKRSSGDSPTTTGQKGKKSDKRGHNIRVKWRIRQYPRGWRESRKKFFKETDVDFQPLHLRNVDAVQFTMSKCTVKAQADSIVVILHEFYYLDAVELLPEIIKLAFSMQDKIQRKFDQLVLSDDPVITVGEAANEQDVLAQMRKKKGYQVIKHKDGKNRVIIDFSPGKGIPELEFVHPGLFDQDQERYEQRFPQILDSPYEYDEVVLMAEQAKAENVDQDARIAALTGAGEKILQVSAEITKNHNLYAENIESHIGAIRMLGTQMEKFVSIVERLDKKLGGGDGK